MVDKFEIEVISVPEALNNNLPVAIEPPLPSYTLAVGNRATINLAAEDIDGDEITYELRFVD